jgi:hypothetical protein
MEKVDSTMTNASGEMSIHATSAEMQLREKGSWPDEIW